MGVNLRPVGFTGALSSNESRDLCAALGFHMWALGPDCSSWMNREVQTPRHLIDEISQHILGFLYPLVSSFLCYFFPFVSLLFFGFSFFLTVSLKTCILYESDLSCLIGTTPKNQLLLLQKLLLFALRITVIFPEMVSQVKDLRRELIRRIDNT